MGVSYCLQFGNRLIGLINKNYQLSKSMKKLYLNRAKTEIARPNTIRNINRQIVLNYVRDRSPISRAAIAKETTLNRSTVSTIIEALHLDGLIEEIGMGNSSGGRKPTMLKLKIGKAVALGVDVTPSKTTVAVADISGKILEREDFPTVTNVDEMTEMIIRKVSKLINLFRKSELEIGISVPGITDYRSGKVLYVPYFQWRDWDISSILAEKTNLNVTIENDANAIALAEMWFGDPRIREIKNFITVSVGEGIGTGIIFDGQIYRGEKGAAGEFGHMIVGKNAPVPCSCGSRDCWEALASEKSALARYFQLLPEKNGHCPNFNIDNLIEKALRGDPNALQALQETGRYLGIGISNLIVGLSPQAVVISGGFSRAWEFIADELKLLTNRSVRDGLPATLLMTSTLGSNPTLIGSINLVLARKFASA
jgi:N-acetylglucosamine repressor